MVPPARGQGQTSSAAEHPRAQKIVRTANLEIVATDFERIRPAIDRIVKEVGSFVGQIQASDAGRSRSLHATLRVPASRFDDAVRSFARSGVWWTRGSRATM